MTGLAHLLSANQDVGRRHFIPLGYTEDPKVRAIFCHAMSHTLGLGTRFDVSSTTDLSVQRNVLCEVRILQYHRPCMRGAKERVAC